MYSSASDVLDDVKERVGRLAKRAQDPTLAPDSADDSELESYLKEALKEICGQTARIETTTTPQTTASQGYVALPSHIDHIQEAQVYDSGTAYPLDIAPGVEVAKAAQAPDATEGRPSCAGSHAGKLWLYEVPDAQYDLWIAATMNGATDPKPQPGDDTVPPGLDALTDRIPAELETALVAYVAGQWLKSDAPELAATELKTFRSTTKRYDADPQAPTTSERPYNPLGL
jgi:hypothetical protein